MSFISDFILFKLPNEGRKYPLWRIWLFIAGIKAFTSSLRNNMGFCFAIKYMWFYWKGLIINSKGFKFYETEEVIQMPCKGKGKMSLPKSKGKK